MSDLCEVLKNFDESTQMVSGDNTIICVTIPLLCLLKRLLLTIMEDDLNVADEVTGEEMTQGDSQTSPSSSSQCELGHEEEEEELETLASATEASVPMEL